MDEAAVAINDEMPWLGIETAHDLVQCFERHREYCWHHSRLPEWWKRQVV